MMLWALLAAAGAAPTAAPFVCDFQTSWRDCGFHAQSRTPERITSTQVAGQPGVRLETRPGDEDIAGSGGAERTDLTLTPEATGCEQGAEQWWEHTLLFPDDYVLPVADNAHPWPWAVLFDFHHSRIGGGQANFEIEVAGRPPVLQLAVSGGPAVSNGGPGSATQRFPIGPVVKNHWYRFIYHVMWSAQGDGFFDAWVDGRQVLAYKGPTLYAGQTCYQKLANYHTPVGAPVAVVHGKVERAATRAGLDP